MTIWGNVSSLDNNMENITNLETFQQLGATLLTKQPDFHASYKSGSISEKLSHHTSRQLLKTAAESIRRYKDTDDFIPSVYLLEKIAATSDKDWTLFCDEVVDIVTKTAATALAIPIGASLGAASTLIANAPGAIAKALPIIGTSGGSAISSAEHILGEDDVNTEKLKAAIAKYKLLTAKLDREINTRYVDLQKLDDANKKRRALRSF